MTQFYDVSQFGRGRALTWYSCACFQHHYELVRDGFLKRDLCLEDWVWMGGIANADAVDGEGWIALL